MNRNTFIRAAKRTAGILLLSALIPHPSAFADDSVKPQSLDGKALYRDVTSIVASTNVHYTQGASFLFTNLTLYASAYSTNPTIQSLTNVTVAVAMSTSTGSTGVWYSATIQDAAAGKVCCTIPTMPSSATVYWQAKATDATTNIYYYTIGYLYADPHL